MTTTADLIAVPTSFTSETVGDLYAKLYSNIITHIADPDIEKQMRERLNAIIQVSNIDDEVDDAAAGL